MSNKYIDSDSSQEHIERDMEETSASGNLLTTVCGILSIVLQFIALITEQFIYLQGAIILIIIGVLALCAQKCVQIYSI